MVYFDEGSAMDLISIKNGGNLIEQTVEAKKSGNTVLGGAKAGISAGRGIRKLLDMFLVDIEGKVKFDAELYRNKDKFIESTLSNTILTDFISLVRRQRKRPRDVEILSDYKIEIVEESIAYFQRISPYLIFTEGKVDLGDGLNMEINKLQDALRVAKGYYELLAINKKNNDEVILRFNNAEFRNNYSISDLDQMNLLFYGIKVGKMDKNLLNFENLMETYSGTNSSAGNDAILHIKREFKNKDEKSVNKHNDIVKLDVFDVVLAGVKK